MSKELQSRRETGISQENMYIKALSKDDTYDKPNAVIHLNMRKLPEEDDTFKALLTT